MLQTNENGFKRDGVAVLVLWPITDDYNICGQKHFLSFFGEWREIYEWKSDCKPKANLGLPIFLTY
jgi:hypothetical protein